MAQRSASERLSFNSRTLGRVRLSTFALRPSFGVFQFTHPGKGATPYGKRTTRSSACFNSRTLGRVRLCLLKPDALGLHVSIHAPWEGCDFIVPPFSILDTRFNSRTLGRVRPTSCLSLSWVIMFQFTHPGKGATESALHQAHEKPFQFTHPGKGATGYHNRIKLGVVVSIHAPWEGCDM